MLRDITGLYTVTGGNVTLNSANSQDIDTHSKEDRIWCLVVNATNTNFQLTNREGIIIGIVPRYTQVAVYFPQRDMAVQLVPINNGGAANANAPNKIWIGFDKERLGDSYTLAF